MLEKNIKIEHYIKIIYQKDATYLLGYTENNCEFFLKNIHTQEIIPLKEPYQTMLKKKYLFSKKRKNLYIKEILLLTLLSMGIYSCSEAKLDEAEQKAKLRIKVYENMDEKNQF